jgi:hypothetical protein
MANNSENSDGGKFARHPLRTMGGSLILGAGIGAGMMAAKHQQNKSALQKIINHLGDKMQK